MYVSSTPRIKPHLDLARAGFQSARRTRVSTPIENRNAIQTLEVDRQLQAELERDYAYMGRPAFRSHAR